MKQLDNQKFEYADVYGNTYVLVFAVGLYSTTLNQAVQIFCEDSGYLEPYCSLTVNLNKVPKGYAYLDTNNCPEKIIRGLEEEGLVAKTGTSMRSGFCIYPLYNIENLLDVCKDMEDF